MSAESFKLQPLIDVIDGEVMPTADKLTDFNCNPSTAEPLQPQGMTPSVGRQQALEAAHRAHQQAAWQRVPINDRVALLEHIADQLDKQLEKFAFIEALTSGIVLQQARLVAEVIPQAFRQAAQYMRESGRTAALTSALWLSRRPRGPVLVIPSALGGAASAAGPVAAALAAGCPVILYPSDDAPYSCALLAEIIAEVGMSRGVFQMINGGRESAMALAQDARIQTVVYSGDRGLGLRLARFGAEMGKTVHLQLSYVTPFILLEQTDIPQAVEHIITTLTLLNGQWLYRPDVIWVPAGLYHRLLIHLVDALSQLRLGAATAPETQLGPQHHPRYLTETRDAINQLMSTGAIINETSALPPGAGYFQSPVLLTNTPQAYLRQHIPGPVASVMYYREPSELLNRLHQVGTITASYVFGQEERQAYSLAQQIPAGSVAINHVRLTGLHPQAPQFNWAEAAAGQTAMAQLFERMLAPHLIALPEH